MKELHEELKELRLEKGVTLEDIHERTKIRIQLLESMEEGNLDIVPVPFMRAFLREYADTVGADPDRVILRYENKIPALREPRPVGQPKPGAQDAPGEHPDVSAAAVSPRREISAETPAPVDAGESVTHDAPAFEGVPIRPGRHAGSAADVPAPAVTGMDSVDEATGEFTDGTEPGATPDDDAATEETSQPGGKKHEAPPAVEPSETAPTGTDTPEQSAVPPAEQSSDDTPADVTGRSVEAPSQRGKRGKRKGRRRKSKDGQPSLFNEDTPDDTPTTGDADGTDAGPIKDTSTAQAPGQDEEQPAASSGGIRVTESVESASVGQRADRTAAERPRLQIEEPGSPGGIFFFIFFVVIIIAAVIIFMLNRGL